MSFVVFLRAANVGGHQVFRPSDLVKELAALDPVNIGAAGTFVIRKNGPEKAVREAFRKNLPFEPELTICSDKDLLTFMRREPFKGFPAGKEFVHAVGILERAAAKSPRLPIVERPGADWQVKIDGVYGRFVVILRRRTGKAVLDPSSIIEKNFGVKATVRNWATLQKIAGVLQQNTYPKSMT